MKWQIFLSLGWLLVGTLSAQYQPDVMQDLRVDVVYLSSDLLAGRETGTEGERWAAQYIAERFAEVGLQPKGSGGTWYQSFDFNFNPNPHSAGGGEARTGKNVIGYLDNEAERTVVIGAHYDHLGHGIFGSLHTGEPAAHNGADDNASGVAAMIRVAERLAQSDLKNNNYLFIAFSGEELGLYGSKYFVNNPTVDLSTANYMLNLDMVGRLNEERILVINGAGTSPAWKPAFNEIKINGMKVHTSDSGIGPSDHTSFYLKDIPAVHFFTGAHEHYHRPGDDAELINWTGLYDITEFMFTLIKNLNEQGAMKFTKTKDEDDSRKAAAFKVTLGVMPDYAYTGAGMRIDAVIDGRPGAKAGLENGDVVIQIGDFEVKDIYGYMEGLSQHKKGDKTDVTVLRKGKKVTRKVEF